MPNYLSVKSLNALRKTVRPKGQTVGVMQDIYDVLRSVEKHLDNPADNPWNAEEISKKLNSIKSSISPQYQNLKNKAEIDAALNEIQNTFGVDTGGVERSRESKYSDFILNDEKDYFSQQLLEEDYHGKPSEKEREDLKSWQAEVDRDTQVRVNALDSVLNTFAMTSGEADGQKEKLQDKGTKKMLTAVRNLRDRIEEKNATPRDYEKAYLSMREYAMTDSRAKEHNREFMNLRVNSVMRGLSAITPEKEFQSLCQQMDHYGSRGKDVSFEKGYLNNVHTLYHDMRKELLSYQKTMKARKTPNAMDTPENRRTLAGMMVLADQDMKKQVSRRELSRKVDDYLADPKNYAIMGAMLRSGKIEKIADMAQKEKPKKKLDALYQSVDKVMGNRTSQFGFQDKSVSQMFLNTQWMRKKIDLTTRFLLSREEELDKLDGKEPAGEKYQIALAALKGLNSRRFKSTDNCREEYVMTADAIADFVREQAGSRTETAQKRVKLMLEAGAEVMTDHEFQTLCADVNKARGLTEYDKGNSLYVDPKKMFGVNDYQKQMEAEKKKRSEVFTRSIRDMRRVLKFDNKNIGREKAADIAYGLELLNEAAVGEENCWKGSKKPTSFKRYALQDPAKFVATMYTGANEISGAMRSSDIEEKYRCRDAYEKLLTKDPERLITTLEDIGKGVSGARAYLDRVLLKRPDTLKTLPKDDQSYQEYEEELDKRLNKEKEEKKAEEKPVEKAEEQFDEKEDAKEDEKEDEKENELPTEEEISLPTEEEIEKNKAAQETERQKRLEEEAKRQAEAEKQRQTELLEKADEQAAMAAKFFQRARETYDSLRRHGSNVTRGRNITVLKMDLFNEMAANPKDFLTRYPGLDVQTIDNPETLNQYVKGNPELNQRKVLLSYYHELKPQEVVDSLTAEHNAKAPHERTLRSRQMGILTPILEGWNHYKRNYEKNQTNPNPEEAKRLQTQKTFLENRVSEFSQKPTSSVRENVPGFPEYERAQAEPLFSKTAFWQQPQQQPQQSQPEYIDINAL